MQMSTVMDESFAYFFNDKGFGPAIQTQTMSPEKIAKFRGKLPDQLLTYWQNYGVSGYGKGLFWLVDPDEYEPALDAWIGDTDFMEKDAYYVVARSAFGELFLWGTKSGQSVDIKSLWGMMFPRDNSERVAHGKSDFLLRNFLAGQSAKDLDQKDPSRQTPLRPSAQDTRTVGVGRDVRLRTCTGNWRQGRPEEPAKGQGRRALGDAGPAR